MSEDATALKSRGNKLFKAGAFLKASKVYEQAEKADPNNPVYPSNLSAAPLELGDYAGCLESVLRAWRCMPAQSDQKMELATRLGRRLCKALCHGARAGTITRDSLTKHREGIDQLRVASSTECSKGDASSGVQGWEEWDSTRLEIDECAKKRDVCLAGLARMPLFFQPLDDTKEYYPIGHDEFIDLTSGCGSVDPRPLNITALPLKDTQKLAFLYGGVGDARHVLATIRGLSTACSNLPKAKKAKFHAHLTLLDINATMIARDLCVFLLLHELNNTSDATARAEIKATLMYMFCGAAMPSYCYDRLSGLFKDLSARFSSRTWDLPTWIHLDQATATAVVRVLDYWLNASKSTQKMLECHEVPPPRSSRLPPPTFRPGTQSDFQQRLQHKLTQERQLMRATFLNMSHDQIQSVLMKAGILSSPVSPTAARADLLKNMDVLIDMYQEQFFGDRRTLEMEWYGQTKVFVPPKELSDRHADLYATWKQVLNDEVISRQALRKVCAHIENSWKPNITLFDPYLDDPHCIYVEATEGYPSFNEEVFAPIKHMHEFNSPDVFLGMETTASEVCDIFFEAAAAALETLEKSIVLDFIVGELCDKLAQMRHNGRTTRPEDFPRKYTRMWLSNVPDYTHGPLNVVLNVAPNLQDHPQAGLACNSLLNSSAWKDDEEFFHTYTLLTIKDLSRYLGCDILDSRAMMDVLVLGASPSFPRPLAELASREELITWLTRLLFNTVVPGRTQPPPCNIRLPHNLVAFFGTLMHLSRIGYPGHWLSEFLPRILSGRMVSDIAPYTGEYPIPVEERTRRVPSRAVRTDPWLVEFETIIATAYHAVPFPVAGALPPELSRNPEDITLWEARVRPNASFLPGKGFYSNPYEPRGQLLFYRSDKLTAREVIASVHEVFEGKATPAPGMFFVITGPEHVVYWDRIWFRLSGLRVERMRAEKWSIVVYRNDTGAPATQPAPISSWLAKDNVA
ncbi:hypothetical protein C8T65DRAFT_736355 [Cerioporus squamosus]|nr:hypothetical protein C8T65DRAFT_736355 [Cerioporus squamosus]